ncbi:UDP-2,3-diacylglucosamine diphosphatase [soil metagenome]
MIIFLSDLHLGRGSSQESRDAEKDVLLLLQEHDYVLRTQPGAALFLVGDVFDQYIEYRHLVPKGFVRFQGHLAGLADAGVPVTYVVGNRDPWHLDYFETELGIKVVRNALQAKLAERSVYIAHGDGLVPAERIYNRIKPLLRNSLIARAYRNGLPGDAAYALARVVGRRSRGTRTGGVGTPDATHALELAAGQIIRETETNAVVFGHSHTASLKRWPEGIYVNPGYWFKNRTFVTLSSDGFRLLEWRDGRAVVLTSEAPPRHA